VERGQIVALATEVIPPENTPEKKKTDTLVAHPRWRYVGPRDTIRFEWQIGKWGWAGFAGETARKYSTHSQPASPVLTPFTTSLSAISLSPLSPGYYDCEIWFKDKFSDLRVIVQNCVRIVEEVPPPPPPQYVWYPPGEYTQIGILAPSSAPAGSRVNIEISLVNRSSYALNMWPGRTRYNDTIFRVYDAAGRMHVVVPAGGTHTWTGHFTMPNRDIEILVESWYEGETKWWPDYSITHPIRRG